MEKVSQNLDSENEEDGPKKVDELTSSNEAITVTSNKTHVFRHPPAKTLLESMENDGVVRRRVKKKATRCMSGLDLDTVELFHMKHNSANNVEYVSKFVNLQTRCITTRHDLTNISLNKVTFL